MGRDLSSAMEAPEVIVTLFGVTLMVSASVIVPTTNLTPRATKISPDESSVLNAVPVPLTTPPEIATVPDREMSSVSGRMYGAPASETNRETL